MNSLPSLDQIHIVLSHPSHPGNIGAVARAMKTMGLSRLVLIAPKSFPHEEATARASGAADILEQARVFTSLDEALAGSTLVAGMTARRRDLSAPFVWAREAATQLIAAAAATMPVAEARVGNISLLFGNETAGLSNEELSRCHLGVMIPTNSAYSSLNLGSAAQLMCYELRMAAQALSDAPEKVTGQTTQLATNEAVEGFYAHLERVAITNGFLDPKQPKRLMPRLRRLFARVHLEHDEVSILRGFLSTIEKPKLRQ